MKTEREEDTASATQRGDDEPASVDGPAARGTDADRPAFMAFSDD